jgi:hypothetical protein
MNIAIRIVTFSTLGIAAAFLAGCATAKVTDETPPIVAPAPPDVVYVGTFDLGASTVQTDPGTLTGRPRLINFRLKDPTEELQELGDLLSDEIAIDLNKAGLPAQRIDPDAAPPAHGWLVSGEFLQVTQGNRLQRAVLGFGNSDAKLYVAVADLAHPESKDLFNFNADSTGNNLPGGGVGAVVTHTPWGMVAKFVLERNASEKDVKRVAKAIANSILVYAGRGSGQN